MTIIQKFPNLGRFVWQQRLLKIYSEMSTVDVLLEKAKYRLTEEVARNEDEEMEIGGEVFIIMQRKDPSKADQEMERLLDWQRQLNIRRKKVISLHNKILLKSTREALGKNPRATRRVRD